MHENDKVIRIYQHIDCHFSEARFLSKGIYVTRIAMKTAEISLNVAD